MSLNLFKDKKNQELFDRQGFVVIDFLDDQTITDLNKLFDNLNADIQQKGMVIGSLIDDRDYKINVEESIYKLIKTNLDVVFLNYEVFNSSFVYKTPKTYTDFPPHQDNSMVDESKFTSLNLWIPLVDITLHNGPLFVVPGTHFKNLQTYRGPNINYIYLNNSEVVYKYSKPLYIKKGQAIVLNHSLIHYSTPNFTSNTRKAIVVAIKSVNAPSLLYYFNQSKEIIEVYKVDEKLKYSYEKFHYDRNEKPDGEILMQFSFDNKIYNSEELNIKFQELVHLSSPGIKNMSLYKLKNSITRLYIQFMAKLLR